MIEFLLALIPLGLGIVCLFRPKQVGLAFCCLGKTIWRVSTFGLTDMRWFYPEDKAPRIMRMLGIMLILAGIISGVIAVLSVSGPGAFAALHESRVYLSERFGSPRDRSNMSATSAATEDGAYLVTYRYGQHSGVLHASWEQNHYMFTEVENPPNKAPEPTPMSVTPAASAPVAPATGAAHL